ncbi:MAG: DUF5652 family protein [Armatimonadota bacterium]
MNEGMDVMPGIMGAVGTVGIVLLSIWSVVWKAIGLWKAARRDRLWWYIAMLVLNTAGILPIIYIFAVAPNQPEIGTEIAAPERPPGQ